MIFSHQDYLSALYHELNRSPDKVWVSTFNLNAGISARGGVYSQSDTHRVLQFINEKVPNSRILVGLALAQPDQTRKLINTAEFFPRILWKYNHSLHLKCWIFFHRSGPLALLGGRNLGDSTWLDASVFLNKTHTRRLITFFDHCWMNSIIVPRSTGLKLL